MKSHTVNMEAWGKANGYRVCVHQIKDSAVYDSGRLNPKNVRSFRILVTYQNHSNEPLPFRCGQWKLFDTEGFNYEFELRNQFYGDDLLRKLSEGVVDPGQQAKGWVAFQLPPDAEPAHVQFRPNGLSQYVVNVRLKSIEYSDGV